VFARVSSAAGLLVVAGILAACSDAPSSLIANSKQPLRISAARAADSATDVNTDPVCAVNMPHFVAAKNTAPNGVLIWQVNSTLVNCQGTMHTFNLTLIDPRTGQVLATAQQSVFM